MPPTSKPSRPLVSAGLAEHGPVVESVGKAFEDIELQAGLGEDLPGAEEYLQIDVIGVRGQFSHTPDRVLNPELPGEPHRLFRKSHSQGDLHFVDASAMPCMFGCQAPTGRISTSGMPSASTHTPQGPPPSLVPSSTSVPSMRSTGW